jgi:hypothetical protein
VCTTNVADQPRRTTYRRLVTDGELPPGTVVLGAQARWVDLTPMIG